MPLHDELAEQLSVQNSVALGGDIRSAVMPYLPSLLRSQNRRYSMDLIDTTKTPDFKALTDVGFDHDIYVATQMISSDSVTGFEIGGDGIKEDLLDSLEVLDNDFDLREIYRLIVYDELRFGNAIVKKNFKTIQDKRLMTGLEIVHPGKIVDMALSDLNIPKWWVFDRVNVDNFLGSMQTNVAFVDPDFLDEFNGRHGNAEVVGLASDIVHFKGAAPPYQKWGVGITQVAKLLVEAKQDMLIDFSKIIKKEAATKEVVFIDVKKMNPDTAQAKIDKTIEEMNKQRKLGNIIVLGKDGKDDALEFITVGSEGKVLDNFTLHYRSDILRAIRILTRIPPSFWLGESTNKATINSQIVIYKRFLKTIREHTTTRFARFITVPFLQQQVRRTVLIKDSPVFLFSDLAVEDPMDRAFINQIAVLTGVKSRRQVAKENGYELPEEADEGVPSPSQTDANASQVMLENYIGESLGVIQND